MKHKLHLTALMLLMGLLGVEAQNENLMNKLINSNAPVKCSMSIIIKSTPQKVWSVLTNIDQWDTWQIDISKPKLIGELKPNSKFDWKTGGAKIHSKLHTVETNKAFGWTGKTFGAFAIHNWKITEIDDSTKVTVHESMEGFLTKIFKKSFNKNLAKGMQHWLELLKIECEKNN
jgi:uncharacterized protein YndB with AHSA1/START domain